jgi:hypothetical protein
MDGLLKYPRTPHIKGSGLQRGDEDMQVVDISRLRGRHMVVEEKVDGSNTRIGWDAGGDAFAGSRGHLIDLTRRDIHRERQWNRFKDWLAIHNDRFLERFEDRFRPFGEWCYAGHTSFYDTLPHWWFEFDVYDRSTESFLGTKERNALMEGLPIVSVPVLYEGPVVDFEHLMSLTTVRDPETGRDLRWTEASLYKGAGWEDALIGSIRREGLDPARNVGHFEPTRAAEGLYIKIEEDGRVVERYKLVRPDFVQKILSSEEHWHNRPIVPNVLMPGADIYAGTLHWLDDGAAPPAPRP